MRIKEYITITPRRVVLNGLQLETQATGGAILTELYRTRVNDYPKYFKMDALSRLGFVASELLLRAEGDRHADSEDRAVILFNRSSSLCNDRKYQRTIQSVDDYFPSPAIFVYTLPNIVTGEIAIRNKYYGETSFYVLEAFDAKPIYETARAALMSDMESAVCGWVDCDGEDEFQAVLFLVERFGGDNFTIENIQKTYHDGRIND